ncbi:MAG: hypothetical protein RSC24_06805 [Clostridium sp.]
MENIKKGIKFGDRFLLYGDGMNICLEEFGEKFNGKTKTTSFGSKGVRYYGNVEQAINYILSNETYSCEMSNFRDLVKVIAKFRDDFKDFRSVTTISGNSIIEN